MEGRTRWDLGQQHPLTPEILNLARQFGFREGAKVYLPGCGRAHDGQFMQDIGCDVTAADLSPAAIPEAKAAYPTLRIICEDATVVSPSERDSYDVNFDRAMLCALRAELRPAYVKSCLERLRQGGLFVGILFSQVGLTVEGPPFAISENELRQLFEPAFSIKLMQTRRDGPVDDRVLEERLFIAQKM